MKKIVILLAVAVSLLLDGCATTGYSSPGYTQTKSYLQSDADRRSWQNFHNNQKIIKMYKATVARSW